VKPAAIHGKILALLREYRFREVKDGYVRKFFTRSRIPPLPGMGLEWWLTRDGLQVRNELARMVVVALPHLPLRVDFVAALIEKVLQDHGDDSALFVPFSYHRANSLLEIRATPEAALAQAIWQILVDEIESAVTEWLVVVPAHRFQTKFVDVGFDGLLLTDRRDVAAWQVVAADFKNAAQWDPRTGVSDEKDPKIFRDRLPEAWMLCRVTGTADGATTTAGDRFRTLVALVFSLEHPAHPELLIKKMADSPTWSVQFASKAGHTEWAHRYSHIGALVPQSFADINVTSDLLAGVRKWYAGRDSANPEQRQRSVVASHFITHGLLAGELERFIHFFIAVDALFGIRGKVEASIKSGVEQALNDPAWGHRASKLFDLRNELVHGNASSVEMWSRYEDYRRHFRTDPVDDIAVIVMTSLRTYFG
jgi:hypothetical protein